MHDNEVVLYRKNPLGIGTWRIWNVGSVIHIEHATQIGGQEVHHTEQVETNQSGRTIDEQIQLRINSRISRQLDKGYKTTLEEARQGATNQLGLLAPMLAQPFDKVRTEKITWDGATVQRKYDGHRCLITRQGGELLAYSRKGKIINSVSHILEPLKSRLPEGYTLDGELYIKDVPLQTLSSLIRRVQEGSQLLRYHVYDLISPDNFVERFSEIREIVPVRECPIEIVPTYMVDDMEEVLKFFRQFRDEGYEGAILRQATTGYEDNKRSKQLIKIKEWQDNEFPVVEVTRGRNDIGILTVKMSDGRTFNCTAPGNMIEKVHTALHPENYIGRFVTVEFSNFTIDGIPFQPVALRYRDDI